jgi:hypothetical protein
MLHPPLSYMAGYYPPYHLSYPPSHIDNETGADTKNNAVNKTSTAAVARRPSSPPHQTNNHYCPLLSGNDSSSINSNDCNYEYDDVIEESDNNNSNNNTNDFNNCRRLLEERKPDSNDNNDNNNVFFSNAISSNSSSASSGNDSAPATIKQPSAINEANKRRKLDSSNNSDTATTYAVTSIITKKDGIVHNVRPVAVSYTQKRGSGGGGVLPSSTSTTANRRRKKRKYHTSEERLAHLSDYKKHNGDCNVPQSFQGYGNLGSWIDNQSHEYKLYSSMTKEQFYALEKLGFKWRINTKHNFEDRLAQLADYKDKNGHLNIPQRFQGYGKLGGWINLLGQKYKKYKENKSSNMTKERIRALEKLDFKWRIYTKHT